MIRNAPDVWKVVFFVSISLFIVIPCCLWNVFFTWILTCITCVLASVYLTLSLLQRNAAFSSDMLIELTKKFHQSKDLSILVSPKSHSKPGGDNNVKKIGMDNQIYGAHCVIDVNIDSCLHFIMRDFVYSWYHSISCNHQFSNETYYLMEDLSVALTSRLRKVDKYSTFKKFIRLYHRHFRDYLRALEKVREKRQTANVFECMSLTADIESCFCDWHPAMTDKYSEVVYMRSVVNSLLEVLTPVDILACTLNRKILSEILVRNVMIPLMDFLSNPNWVNRKLIDLLADDPVTVTNVINNYSHPEDEVITDTKAAEEIVSNYCKEQIKVEPNEIPLKEQQRLSIKEELFALSTSNYHHQLGNSRMSDNGSSNWKLKRNSVVEESHVLKMASASDKSSIFPTSKSLEHLSSLFLNKLSDIEKPIEYITDNIAQIFRTSSNVSGDHVKNKSETGRLKKDASLEHTQRRESVPVPVPPPPMLDCNNATAIDESDTQLIHRRSSCNDGVIVRPNSISFALENAITASTGPVLADKLNRLEVAAVVLPNDLPLTPIEEVGSFIGCGNNQKLSSTSLLDSAIDAFSSRDNLRLKLNIKSPTSLLFHSASKNLPTSQSGTPSDCTDGVLEAVEMSPDNRCFMNLHIPTTELMEEPGGGSQYALYCIEYEAWYLDHTLNNHVSDPGPFEVSEPRMVLQGSQVKRRFREFTTLHSRLEENPQLKRYLHDVHKPNRWSLPFSKLDRETIEERRIFLEKYLQKLISKDELAASSELREFLAYGSDASIAYVKKLPDSMVPRFDKFLVKKVSGMFEKIRTVLPTLPMETSPVDHAFNHAKSGERRSFLGFQFGNQDETYSIALHFGLAERETNNIEDHLRKFVNDSQYGDQVDTCGRFSHETVKGKQEICVPLSPVTPTLPICPGFDNVTNGGFSQVSETRQMHSVDHDIPLTSSVLHLALDVLRETDTSLKKHNVLLAFKLLSGKLMESWLHDKIDAYTTQAMCIRYVGRIRDAIWPGGLLPMEPEIEWTEDENFQAKQDALHCLKDMLPSILPYVVGNDQYDMCMQLFLDSLQHPKLLRHFFYNTLDLIVDVLAPETKSESFQTRFADVM